MLLYSEVVDGLYNIIACLESRKNSINKKIEAITIVGRMAALYIAVFFFGLAG
jgi:hypothetical protein